MKTIQGELFPRNQYEHLFPYWKKRLKEWIQDVWMYRHFRGCTGWSMARQGLCFARLLFQEGQITREQFSRFVRLKIRVDRWDKKGRN